MKSNGTVNTDFRCSIPELRNLRIFVALHCNTPLEPGLRYSGYHLTPEDVVCSSLVGYRGLDACSKTGKRNRPQ